MERLWNDNHSHSESAEGENPHSQVEDEMAAPDERVASANADDAGLRRRNVARDAAELPAEANGDAAAHSEASTPRAQPARRQKGFVELLFSPLSFVLGDGEPEDPQVSREEEGCNGVVRCGLADGECAAGVGARVHAQSAPPVRRGCDPSLRALVVPRRRVDGADGVQVPAGVSAFEHPRAGRLVLSVRLVTTWERFAAFRC